MTMKRKLLMLITFSLLFLSIFQLGTTRDGVVKENIEDISNTWEQVIIIETHNISHSERIEFPFFNITDELVFFNYFAVVNSTQIETIILRKYLPPQTPLVLLFKNGTYFDYKEVF
jgi:hypothetical protein